MRWLARLRCHRSVVCCQYVDLPSCNSTRETHRLGRWAWRRRAEA